MYFSHLISVLTYSNVHSYEFNLMTEMNHFYILYLYLVRRELNWQVNFIYFLLLDSIALDNVVSIFFVLPPLYHKSRVNYVHMSKRKDFLYPLLSPSYIPTSLSFYSCFCIFDVLRNIDGLFIYNPLMSMKYMHFPG